MHHSSPFKLLSVIACLLSPNPSLLSAPSTELELDETELEWLNNNTVVSFTGDPNWLPYEAFDADGKYIGIVSEHIKLISGLTGIQFKMSPSKTWTESTEKAKNGLVDILSETDDSDLKSHLVFTNRVASLYTDHWNSFSTTTTFLQK